MAPDTKGSRVVDRWAGEGTGDMEYLTADGRYWTTARWPGAGGTGSTSGRVVGDRIQTTDSEESGR